MNGNGAAPATVPVDVSLDASPESAVLRLCACGGVILLFEGADVATTVSWHNLSLSHRIWRWVREAVDERVQ